MVDVPPPVPTQLIVFADDWGRHPSSSQHLIRVLLSQYPTLWVNTVGTRKPGLSARDLMRVCGVLKRWVVGRDGQGEQLPEGLSVSSPVMYPGYRRPWQRRFNAGRVAQAVNAEISQSHRRVVVTTLPTTADLVGKLDADRWVYYCVDDYSQWPGTDHAAMDAMERELVSKVDAVACVSEKLRERIASIGRADSTLLTHGVDVDFWLDRSFEPNQTEQWIMSRKPLALFWGLLDDRLDRSIISELIETCQGSLNGLCLVGPMAAGYFIGASDMGFVSTGPVSHSRLPLYAKHAKVLIMPYIDAPVTRAMQPLKLLEYLATMKPVVVRDLPSTREWADCCDLAGDAETFAKLVVKRARTGTPPEQLAARQRRLPSESWSSKAEQLAAIIDG